MKIGEFARVCNVTKDTVRYYVNIGLLIPKMQGSQMSFEEREYADFNYIQKLKGMRFNIKEIRAFLYLRRMSNMIEPATIDECVKLLEDKRECLASEMITIENSIHLIEDEIESFKNKKNADKRDRTGVPISTVPLLVCPDCRQHLHIENAEINYKYIYEGTLSCPCGYHAIIEQIESQDWNGKVILEANINGFFFTYNNLHQLPKNSVYIIVDKYHEVLAMYKELFEQLYPGLDILYIADASEKFPLQDSCIDLFLSFYGEIEYSFYHKNVQLHDICHLMKPKGLIFGAFQSFAPEAKSRRLLIERYPEGHKRLANMTYLIEDYLKCGYKISAVETGKIMKTEDHHMYICHLDAEPLTIYYFVAEKEN